MATYPVLVVLSILILLEFKLSYGRILDESVDRAWKKNKVFEYHPVPDPFVPHHVQRPRYNNRSPPRQFHYNRRGYPRRKFKSQPTEHFSIWNEFGNNVESQWTSHTTNNEFQITATCNENEECYSSKESSKEILHEPPEIHTHSSEVMVLESDDDSDEVQQHEHHDDHNSSKKGMKKLFQFAMPLLVGLMAWLATLMMMSSAMTNTAATTSTTFDSEEMMSNTPGIHLHMDEEEEEESVTELTEAELLAQEEKEKDKQHEKLLKKLDVTDQVLSIIERGLLLAVRKVELASVVTGFGSSFTSAGTGPGGGGPSLTGGLPDLLQGAIGLLPNLTSARDEVLGELLHLGDNKTETEAPSDSNMTTGLTPSNSSDSMETIMTTELPIKYLPNIVVRPRPSLKPPLTWHQLPMNETTTEEPVTSLSDEPRPRPNSKPENSDSSESDMTTEKSIKYLHPPRPNLKLHMKIPDYSEGDTTTERSTGYMPPRPSNLPTKVPNSSESEESIGYLSDIAMKPRPRPSLKFQTKKVPNSSESDRTTEQAIVYLPDIIMKSRPNLKPIKKPHLYRNTVNNPYLYSNSNANRPNMYYSEPYVYSVVRATTTTTTTERSVPVSAKSSTMSTERSAPARTRSSTASSERNLPRTSTITSYARYATRVKSNTNRGKYKPTGKPLTSDGEAYDFAVPGT